MTGFQDLKKAYPQFFSLESLSSFILLSRQPSYIPKNEGNPSTKYYQNLPKILKVVHDSQEPVNWRTLRTKTQLNKQALGTGLNTLVELGLVTKIDELYFPNRVYYQLRNSCNLLYVPKEVCYVDFIRKQSRDERKNRNYSHSFDDTDAGKGKKRVPLITVRDEQLIIDVNKQGKIIGIELLGNKKARKPCQEAQ